MSEWISVKDDLPKHNTNVLTINKKNDMHVTCFIHHDEMLKVLKKAGVKPQHNYEGEVGSFCSIEFGGLTLNDVTHWMPLPKPPLSNLQ